MAMSSFRHRITSGGCRCIEVSTFWVTVRAWSRLELAVCSATILNVGPPAVQAFVHALDPLDRAGAAWIVGDHHHARAGWDRS
jgi:hypothetical protein